MYIYLHALYTVLEYQILVFLMQIDESQPSKF